MLRFHMSSPVSSSGADDEMPAFDTRMSSPPYSRAAASSAASTADSPVTSIGTARTWSAP